jgi:hypothetical protein
MIIEGIVTTLDPNGEANISPMGPILDLPRETIEFRPFAGSRTLANLLARPMGVFHLTDDALLIAQAVTKRWVEPPLLERATQISGWVIPAACSWHEFKCSFVDQTTNRATVKANIVASGRGLDFAGFNRAKHAILEAAVMVSRLDFLPLPEIELALQNAGRLCDKTGSPRERLAIEVLQAFVNAHQPSHTGSSEPATSTTDDAQ